MNIDIEYKSRIYTYKAITEMVMKDLKVIAGAVLSGRTLEIEENTDGFDMYPSCNHWEKKYCHCKPKKYMGYIKPGGYVVFADSEIGIYCKVIELFLGRRVNIPFSNFRGCEQNDRD